MAEEDDYMSDAFLADVARPSLVFSRNTARKHEMERKRVKSDRENRSVSVKGRETERRNEGLSTELKEDNKGFALLKKMGYVEGSGLGKLGQGRTEPVPVAVKNDRCGIGTTTQSKRKGVSAAVSAALAAKRACIETDIRADFQQRMKDKFADVEFLRDLGKSQRACYQLDQAKNLSCVQPWYWPAGCRPDDDSDDDSDDEEEEDNSNELKLRLVTQHLRQVHSYCVWCGNGYADSEEMLRMCPGDTAQDHD